MSGLLKWAVVVILALAVIPEKFKENVGKGIEAEFKRVDIETFEVAGYEVRVSDYEVDRTMLNSPIIRAYTFTVKRYGVKVTTFHLQREFRMEWASSGEASQEYTSWTLKEELPKGLLPIKQYPEYDRQILSFPGFEEPLADIRDIIRSRYIESVQ